MTRVSRVARVEGRREALRSRVSVHFAGHTASDPRATPLIRRGLLQVRLTSDVWRLRAAGEGGRSCPHPTQQFRDDVVAVARRGEVLLSQSRRTSGSASRASATGSVAPRSRRPRPARPQESEELRELFNAANRDAQHENDVLRRAAGLPVTVEPAPSFDQVAEQLVTGPSSIPEPRPHAPRADPRWAAAPGCMFWGRTSRSGTRSSTLFVRPAPVSEGAGARSAAVPAWWS